MNFPSIISFKNIFGVFKRPEKIKNQEKINF